METTEAVVDALDRAPGIVVPLVRNPHVAGARHHAVRSRP